jgi:hypothetical protein
VRLEDREGRVAKACARLALDAPVTGIAAARLPEAASLSGLGKRQRFTAVGYGAYRLDTASARTFLAPFVELP